MNILLIGIFGLYLMLVGLNGNSAALRENFSSDAGGFLPWAVSVGVLAVMNEIPLTKKIVAPFLLLLGLNFVLRNWDMLRNQYQQIAQMAQGNKVQP